MTRGPGQLNLLCKNAIFKGGPGNLWGGAHGPARKKAKWKEMKAQKAKMKAQKAKIKEIKAQKAKNKQEIKARKGQNERK